MTFLFYFICLFSPVGWNLIKKQLWPLVQKRKRLNIILKSKFLYAIFTRIEPPLYIYIYIYIYIYCLQQTDCFVVPQLFSVARLLRCLNLGSKPAQIYVRLSITLLGQQAYHVGQGIISFYVATATAELVGLHFILYRIPECSIRSKSFALCKRQPEIPSPECSTPMREASIQWPG